MPSKDLKRVALAHPKKTEKDAFPRERIGLLKHFFELSKDASPKLLLVTTFQLDGEFLEDEVFGQVPEVCKTLLIYSPFSTNSNFQVKAERSNIRLTRARSRVFHPKFILAISGTDLLVGVGSANLTRGGWGGVNQELFHFFVNSRDFYLTKHMPTLDGTILRSCHEYLDKLAAELHPSSYRDRESIEDMQKVLGNVDTKTKAHDERKLLYNYSKSLLDVLKDIPRKQLISIHIFSPIHFDQTDSEDQDEFCENDYKLFDYFRGLFMGKNKPDISFYSSNDVAMNFLGQRGVKFFKNNVSNRSHLKLVALLTTKHAYILSGSANFSVNAFLKTPSSGGNSELMILERRNLKEWNAIKRSLVGESPKEQIGAPIKLRAKPEDSPEFEIWQIDIEKTKSGHQAHIYCNPFIKGCHSVQLLYNSGHKKIVISVSKPLETFNCIGKQWQELIEDGPLFVVSRKGHKDFVIPVNYDRGDCFGEPMTDMDREYADLFSFIGLRWSRRNAIDDPRQTGPDIGELDDREPENVFQSQNDRFYHEWKHIDRKLRQVDEELKNVYREKIKDFVDLNKARHSDSRKDALLTEVQIKFIENRMLK
ncbi:MAG: hypothetical protein QY316_03790 [Thermodesulfobacteriota bacterium]|nr:MAG: hypothetical protein QY316_03790 [Thermodesulfobacteriota bacterium]